MRAAVVQRPPKLRKTLMPALSATDVAAFAESP